MNYQAGRGFLGLWQRAGGTVSRWWDRGYGVRGELDVRRDGLQILRLLMDTEPVDEVSVRSLSAVWACVRNTARTIGALPCRAVRMQADSRGRWLAEPVEAGHWLARLIERPNDWQGFRGLVEDLVWHVELQGAAWMQIRRDRMGVPNGLEPAHPSRVKVEAMGRGLKVTIEGTDGRQRTVPWSELVHVQGDGAGMGPPGLSPLEIHRDTFALAQLIRRYAVGTLRRPLPPVLLETEKRLRDEKVGARIAKEWEDKFSRPDGRARAALLEEGVKARTLDLASLADLQLVEMKDAVDVEIARIFRVPPHKIGVEFAGPLRNLEEQNRSWQMDKVVPSVAGLEDGVRRHLLTAAEREEGLGLRWEVERLVTGDLRAQLERARIGLQTGWLSPDDVRYAFGMPPLPDGKGDIYTVLENLQPIEAVGAEAAAPAPEPEKGGQG